MSVNKLNLLQWFQSSMDNTTAGPSSKKLTAFWALVGITTPVVATWTVWAYKHDDWGYLPMVLATLFSFTAAGLGINSLEKIKGVTNDKTSDPPAPGTGGQ